MLPGQFIKHDDLNKFQKSVIENISKNIMMNPYQYIFTNYFWCARAISMKLLLNKYNNN